MHNQQSAVAVFLFLFLFLFSPLSFGDLSYEDAIENFFAWEQQSLAGTEEVNRTKCEILESKPGKADHSSYARVRSWIDTRKMAGN